MPARHLTRDVPVKIRDGLFAELEFAMTSLPAERSLQWRGENARSGRLCHPKIRSGLENSKPSLGHGTDVKFATKSKSNRDAIAGNYWTDITSVGGSAAAVCVQRWLMEFVERLSMDEIELLATPPRTAS